MSESAIDMNDVLDAFETAIEAVANGVPPYNGVDLLVLRQIILSPASLVSAELWNGYVELRGEDS